MAARLSPKHDAKTREKIQTSQLINRLTKFVNGEVKMESAQVTAALGLLRKVLPDLASTEMKGEVEHNYVARLPERVEDIDDWQKKSQTLLQ